MKNFLINTLIFLLVLAGGLLVGWHYIQEDVILYLTQVPIVADQFDANLVTAIEEAEDTEIDDLDVITSLGAFDWIDHIGVIDELEVGPIGELIMPSIDVRVPIFYGAHEPNISIGAGTYRPNYMWDAPEKRMGEGNLVLASHWDPNPGIRFGGIDQIRAGDLLILRDSHYLYLYETIIENDVVNYYRTDIAHIIDDYVWLTLFTCTPDGSQRTVVRGEFIEKLSISDLNDMLEAGELEALEVLAEVIDLEELASVVEALDETEVPFPVIEVAAVGGGSLLFAMLIVKFSNKGSKKKNKQK